MSTECLHFRKQKSFEEGLANLTRKRRMFLSLFVGGVFCVMFVFQMSGAKKRKRTKEMKAKPLFPIW